MLAPLVLSQDEQRALENCANLYIANGCDDRQFSLPFVSAACRAMLLCLAKGILLTFLASFWVLDWNGDGARVGQAGRAARASH